MKEISLYVHIPFCKQRCFYCDFPTFAGKEQYREEYVNALIKEIDEKCSDYVIKTILRIILSIQWNAIQEHYQKKNCW